LTRGRGASYAVAEITIAPCFYRPVFLFTYMADNNAQKVALITGITGQDGSYLTDLLLEKNYIVHGIRRRASLFNTDRIDHVFLDPHEKEARVFLHYGNLLDSSRLYQLIDRIRPQEIYHLGAQSHVAVSFNVPEYTTNVNAVGTLRLLDAVRHVDPTIKFYQASSSEMYGKVREIPQKETTPFYPRSPYGCSKVYAYWIAKNYRESYNMFVCNGILFNHESPRRGKRFVTRKVTRAAANIKLGNQDKLYLGNLDSRRDWGFAGDYVEAMWLMMQQDTPDDYVIATGEAHSVRELVELAFREVDIEISWQGSGMDEKGIDRKTGRVIIELDPLFIRPAEVDFLLGDSSKARNILGWEPKYSFKELVSQMVQFDLENEARVSGWRNY